MFQVTRNLRDRPGNREFCALLEAHLIEQGRQPEIVKSRGGSGERIIAVIDHSEPIYGPRTKYDWNKIVGFKR